MKAMLTLVTLAVLALEAAAQWSPYASSPPHVGPPRITVEGEATVFVKPDRVVISLGIETWDPVFQKAKERNDAAVKRAFEAIKSCGIPEMSVETDGIAIHPWWRGYHPDGSERGYRGYVVRNMLVVTISDTERVSELIEAAARAGVNLVHTIRFQTTELKKHREQARELALRAAREKAEKMAAALGQSVGKALEVREHSAGWRDWYWSSWSDWGWGGSRDHGMSQVQVYADRGDTPDIADTIAVGKLSIRARVAATFELAD
jgi:uncharacterized protein YggE